MKFCLLFYISTLLCALLAVEADKKTKDWYKQLYSKQKVNNKNNSKYKEYSPSNHKTYTLCEPNNPCIKRSGLVANPFDCCSFYSCHNCRYYLQKCGAGTHFNKKLLFCDFPQTAGCSRAQNFC